MLVKINDVIGDTIRVTKLDIDDFGSIIPLKELKLRLPQYDESIDQTLRNSVYAIVFTADDSEADNSTIILARGMTTEELNEEKERTVRAVQGKRHDAK
jgi:hypothetical protein